VAVVVLLVAAPGLRARDEAPAEWPLSCDLVYGHDAPVEHCARRLPDGALALRPEVLAALAEADGEDGPDVHSLRVDGRWVFALASGATAPALPFDNGPDYFVEDRARILVDGKVGFVDPALDVAVPATWDFAFPFDGGVARVCTGCASAPVAEGDEHLEVRGGRWGLVDRRGRVVVPVVHDRDDPAATAAPATGQAPPSDGR
jgi:hypothetical protein